MVINLNRKTYGPMQTVLSENTSMKGSLKFKHSLQICGVFSGEIETDGVLFVDEGASVTADIKAKAVIVAGTINGNITASDWVEMPGTGKVTGNIKAPKVSIQDGVEYSGQCNMIRDSESIDIFSGNAEKLKKTVSSV